MNESSALASVSLSHNVMMKLTRFESVATTQPAEELTHCPLRCAASLGSIQIISIHLKLKCNL